MMRRAGPVILVLSALLVPACGKKGPIQPPLVRVPQKVEDFKAFQRGDKLRLEWKLPVTYSDGTPFSKAVAVEIWLIKEETPAPAQQAEAEKAPAEAPAAAPAVAAPGQTPAVPPPVSVSGEMPLDIFKEQAVLVSSVSTDFAASPSPAPGLASLPQFYEYALDPARLGCRFTFAVRVTDARGKHSDYSSRVTLAPLKLPQPPQNLKLTLFPDKIVLAWEPPAADIDSSTPAAFAGYAVYRSRGNEPPQSLSALTLIKDPAWTDTNFEFGTTYRYTVRAVLNDMLPSAESGDSPAAEITPRDTFPPAPPAGLKTIAGAGFISLSWEISPEADLAGYRVWRKSAAEADFRLLTETPLLETNYSDRSVRPGVIYHYALTALDKSGNESPRGTPVAETARSPRP